MAQMKTLTWTNPNPVVARNVGFGFEVSSIVTTDVTNGGQWTWNSSMTDDYYVRVDTGVVTAANGFTPLAQSFAIGPAISGFTNADPGVITVDSTSQFGVAVGDVINVVNLADDQSAATSLNDSYTVAGVTATTITLTATTDDTSADSVYVSGGTVLRVTDLAGDPVRQENAAISGVTVGTGAVGAADAVMTVVAYSADPAC